MQISVYVSATLRVFVNRRAKLELEGTTVGEILERLQKEYPDSKKALFEENGMLKPFVGIFVNDIGIWGEDVLETPLKEGDLILLLPVIAGGVPEESVISDERRKAEILDDSEIERYNRHLMLREIGVKGQKRIKAARVLVIGLGALGSSVIQYLAASGVGTIGLYDSGEVSLDGLQSQVIYRMRDVHRPKTASARDVIKGINPKLRIETISEKLEPGYLSELVKGYDIIVDCTDSYQSRYLINDACVMAGKPFSHGGIIRFKGQLMTYVPGAGPCYRCVFKNPPPKDAVPTCRQAGVVGAMGGVIGSLQAMEAIKYITGVGKLLTGSLLTFDAIKMDFHKIRLPRADGSCPVCGTHPTITRPIDYEQAECDGI